MQKLTHFNQAGDAHMVDIGKKDVTRRCAIAMGRIKMRPATLKLIRTGNANKGDVLGIARTAAIMGAKRTADLIPLCHPLSLSHIDVQFELLDDLPGVDCHVTANTNGQTGVEMEALTAVHIALLTIYDMCKAVDRGMVVGDISLIEKSGGKSGHWKRL